MTRRCCCPSSSNGDAMAVAVAGLVVAGWLVSVAAQLLAIATAVLVVVGLAAIALTIVLAAAAVTWSKVAPHPDSEWVELPELATGPVGYLPAGDRTPTQVTDVEEVTR